MCYTKDMSEFTEYMGFRAFLELLNEGETVVEITIVPQERIDLYKYLDKRFPYVQREVIEKYKVLNRIFKDK